jgi:hypothetical protein
MLALPTGSRIFPHQQWQQNLPANMSRPHTTTERQNRSPRLQPHPLPRSRIDFIRRTLITDVGDLLEVPRQKRLDRLGRFVVIHVPTLVRQQPRSQTALHNEDAVTEREAGRTRADEVLLDRNLRQLRIVRGYHCWDLQDSHPLGQCHAHATRQGEAGGNEWNPALRDLLGLRIRPGEVSARQPARREGQTGYNGGMNETTPELKNRAPLGYIEPHALLLKSPPEDQLLYKIVSVENLLRSIDDHYLHFNRVDSYRNFPGADARDGEQIPSDRPVNALSTFQMAPAFSVADYYDRCRARTYACCFSLENSDYIWANYATSARKGKIGLVFRFGSLRAMLNQACDPEKTLLAYNGLPCRNIFSLNYGVVEYVDFDTHSINTPHLPNPIQYVHLKSAALYANEKELRVTLSAPGMGDFVLNDGSYMALPGSLQVPFDFHAAFTNGVIAKLLCSPDSDREFIRDELHKRRIAVASGSNL